MRNVVGDDAMQWVKAIAFTALDYVMSKKESVTGDTGAEGIAKDLGKSELDPPLRTIPSDPEIGWPPPPLEPWVIPSLPGEGQWNPLDKDPFVRTNPGLPPAFLTTFIRTDRGRKATRTYIALWDPRQIELHMMAGTVEPKGATGEAGPGLIPRTPEVLKRVVAASNAGFQALHGEFGMMADGVVYLPPKPYAATVAVLRDGSTGFGSWPLETTIPEQILSYRQNMTVMVQDEKFNPFNRTWWGGTPPGWADKTHTVRTGMCLTKERFIAYFYGADLAPEALAQAMIQARCAFGLALDMNAGHSGLEFYDIEPADQFQPLKQTLQGDWQHEGEVPGLDGWKFRARRLIRGMGLMNFPRYIKREGRDFFYMTLRQVLPGPALVPVIVSSPSPERASGASRASPSTASPTPSPSASCAPTPPGRTSRCARWRSTRAPSPPLRCPGKRRQARRWPCSTPATSPLERRSRSGTRRARSPSLPRRPWRTRCAWPRARPRAKSASPRSASATRGGCSITWRSRGRLRATPADGKILDQLLKKLGCSTRLSLARPLAIALGGDSDLAGTAIRPPAGATAVRLSRAEAAGARRIFDGHAGGAVRYVVSAAAEAHPVLPQERRGAGGGGGREQLISGPAWSATRPGTRARPGSSGCSRRRRRRCGPSSGSAPAST